MLTSTLSKGALVFVLTFIGGNNSAIAVTVKPDISSQTEGRRELVHVQEVGLAEADISLRRLKVTNFSEEEGESFLKRVEEIRKKIGGH